MILYRPFRNSDPPALARLWNLAIPEAGAVRPVRVHELDDHAFGSVLFDRAGLIVAEDEGRVVGYVHAGFGPDLPAGPSPPLVLETGMGTIAMLVVEPGAAGEEAARGLVLRAERYLRARGAKVLYAGGHRPVNPFYWGLYAGSEGAGVLASHPVFPATLLALGYEPVGTTISLRLDLDRPDPRDPRAVLIRRQTELEIEEDALPADWWQNQALGEFHLAHFRLRAKPDGVALARASTFDMTWFGRSDGRPRIGVLDVEVAADRRRKGFGRYLMTQILKWAREHGTALVELQTASTNEPALAFYAAIGFEPVDRSTTYRLPAPLLGRADSPGA